MFKVKDLYVSLTSPGTFSLEVDCVAPKPGNGITPIVVNTTPECCGAASLQLKQQWTILTLQTLTPIEVDRQTFDTLKTYLRTTLTQLELPGPTPFGEEPQNQSHLEMLEEKLSGALEEVRARIDQLQQRAPGKTA